MIEGEYALLMWFDETNDWGCVKKGTHSICFNELKKLINPSTNGWRIIKINN